MLRSFEENRIRAVLIDALSAKSAMYENQSDSAVGQCSAMLTVIHDVFGGTIFRSQFPVGYCYYNRIDRKFVDLTDSQCETPIDHDDELSSR
jgi:hypothetical protein